MNLVELCNNALTDNSTVRIKHGESTSKLETPASLKYSPVQPIRFEENPTPAGGIEHISTQKVGTSEMRVSQQRMMSEPPKINLQDASKPELNSMKNVLA